MGRPSGPVDGLESSEPSTSGRSGLVQHHRRRRLVIASISVRRQALPVEEPNDLLHFDFVVNQVPNKAQGTPPKISSGDKPITDVIAGALARAASQRYCLLHHGW